MSNDAKFPLVGNNKPPCRSKGEESVNEGRTGG
jgi:hypothetical protein